MTPGFNGVYKGTNWALKDKNEGWVEVFDEGWVTERKRATPLFVCEWCSSRYYAEGKYYNKHGFCSEICYMNSITPPEFFELNTELYKSNRPDFKECVICGSMHTGKDPFCSAECSIKYCEQKGIWYQRVKLKLPPKYCKKFNGGFKKRVRGYFGNKCVMCGKSEEENGQALSVHHVNYDKKAGCNGNTLSFVTLCKSCHHKVHGNKEYWKAYFENIINTEYGNKCYYTKEEYKAIKVKKSTY